VRPGLLSTVPSGLVPTRPDGWFVFSLHRRRRPTGDETAFGRKRHEFAGAPSFAFFAKGGIHESRYKLSRIPTLCKERKGWGTRRFMARPALPNMKRELFVFSKRCPNEPIEKANLDNSGSR
jgi:hypothetical protein